MWSFPSWEQWDRSPFFSVRTGQSEHSARGSIWQKTLTLTSRGRAQPECYKWNGCGWIWGIVSQFWFVQLARDDHRLTAPTSTFPGAVHCQVCSSRRAVVVMLSSTTVEDVNPSLPRLLVVSSPSPALTAFAQLLSDSALFIVYILVISPSLWSQTFHVNSSSRKSHQCLWFSSLSCWYDHPFDDCKSNPLSFVCLTRRTELNHFWTV